jgi:hypothetical protein
MIASITRVDEHLVSASALVLESEAEREAAAGTAFLGDKIPGSRLARDQRHNPEAARSPQYRAPELGKQGQNNQPGRLGCHPRARARLIAKACAVDARFDYSWPEADSLARNEARRQDSLHLWPRGNMDMSALGRDPTSTVL